MASQAPTIPRLNTRSPLARGLVACYPLLGSRVQGIDLGPHQAHLTPAGTQAYEWRTLNGHGAFYNTTSTVNGQIGTTDANVRDLIYNNDWSMALWVKQTTVMPFLNPAAIAWHGSDDYLIYPCSSVSGTGTRVYWRDAGGNIILANQGDIVGEVHRLVVTAHRLVNTTDYKFYQDGALIYSSNHPNTAGSSLTGFRVGGWADDASQTMGGYIANVCLWDRTLSPTETRLDYAPGTRWDLISGPSRLFILPTGIAAEVAAPAPTVTLSGTITSGTDESDIVTGGKTIVLTLANDTWVASGATFDAQRQNIIDGLTSAQSETTGWNNEVRDKENVTAVVRTSDTVVTITLSASALYDITATETITATIPATALTGGSAVVASPTFDVAAVGAAAGWGGYDYFYKNLLAGGHL